MKGKKSLLKKIGGAAAGIFLSAVMTLYLPVMALAGNYDIGAGDIEIVATGTEDAPNHTVSQNGSQVSDCDANPTITGSSSEHTVSISAPQDTTATVTLNNVTIDAGGLNKAAVSTSGSGNVVIELDGTNTLQGGDNHAALADSQYPITIQDENAIRGSLTATGGDNGAGIGGGPRVGGHVNITGGIVTATGGDNGAGIGGGPFSEGGNITISGGKVTATGGYKASGIGGGNHGMNGTGVNVTITGGFVTANGGENETGNEAGIGGGNMGVASNNQITGGTVIANGEILFTDGTVDPTLQAETAETDAVETGDDAASDGNAEIASANDFDTFTAQINTQIHSLLQQIAALLTMGRLDLLQALMKSGFSVDLGDFTTLNAKTCALLAQVADAGIPVKADYTYGGVNYRTTIPAGEGATVNALAADGVCTVEELMSAFETQIR